MNIIYIHSHDTGRYVQPYGHAVPTPNLQRLAETGVLFRQAFCAAPTCSPSRASLLTGQSPHSCGQLGLANRGFNLRDTEKHIANTLRANGYRTALFGIQHLHLEPAKLGYDLIVETNRQTGRYDAAARTDDAIAFLAAPHERPFFMTVGYEETHRAFAAPGPAEDPRYTLPPAPLPDTPETRLDMAAFKASARILDHNVGRVLDALAEHGLEENTLVICTTDHGLAFPFMKCSLTDQGMGVMLMMRGPGGFGGGRVVESMISQIDLYPTLCDLASIHPPAWLEGRSFMPVIRNEVDEINDEIFAEVNYHAAYEPKRAVRTRRWKYIRHFDGRGRPSFPNIDDGPTKRRLVKEGLAEFPLAAEQLFDLIFDPNECNNLIDDPAHDEVAVEMRDRLAGWMDATGDPLRAGDIPAPGNVTVNHPEDANPGDIDNYRPPDPWVLRQEVDQLRSA